MAVTQKPLPEEVLLEKGYKEYEVPEFDNPNIEKCFSKKVEDEKGVKYFINLKRWWPLQNNDTGEIMILGDEITIQYYKKDTREAVDVMFHSSWKIDEAEEYAEKIFATGLFDYYGV